MKHFITRGRLNWSYLRRISRGFGAATVGIDAYELAINAGSDGLTQNLRRTWGWQTLATIKGLLRKPMKLLRAPLSSMEGDADVLQIENLWGRLLELLKTRRNYVSNIEALTAQRSRT